MFKVIILFLFCLFSLRSLFHPGFMYSHDSLWHVERLQNMAGLLKTQFPVRWSPELDHGYGVPLFNFTYPAPYYVGAAVMMMGLGPIKVYNLLLFGAYFLGGLGIYLLSRKRSWVGLTASLLYLLTPYQFLDIFVRGALGEVVAMGLIPWVLIVLEQVSRTGKLRWYTALPFALLMVSHNFYGYLFGGLMLGYTLLIYDHKKKVIASLILSLGLVAFFLLPAFIEKSALLFSQTEHLGYRDHFVYPLQLLYSIWSYFGSLPGNDSNEMSYQLGFPGLLILITSLSLLVRRQSISARLGWYLFVVGMSIFMMLPASDFLWRTIPLLSSIQFPWRFLGLTTLMFPLIYLELAQHYTARWFKGISLCLIIIALYGTRNYGRPVKWLSSEEFLDLHYAYVAGTTTAKREEIVPRWSPVERYNAQTIPELSDAKVENYTAQSLTISFDATITEAETLTIPRNYFPMWVGEIDGSPLPLKPADNGDLLVPLSPGQHRYRLAIRETRIEKIGNLISGITLFVLVILSIQQIATRKKQAKS